MTDATIKPLDPARFSTTGPVRPMTAARARAIADGLLAAGEPVDVVREILSHHGHDLGRRFALIEGGKRDG